MGEWLARQPTSQTKLTPFERDMMTEANMSVSDLYFLRALKAHASKSLLHPNAKVPSPRDDFFNEYGSGADHPFQKVKK